MITSNESKLLELALEAAQVASAAEGVQGVAERLNILRRAPIRRAFFLRQLKEELEVEGIEFPSVGAINWEAIGQLFVKYGPIILQIILALF